MKTNSSKDFYTKPQLENEPTIQAKQSISDNKEENREETQTEEEIEPTTPSDPHPSKGPATRTKQ